jgi:hypothetical protein
VGQAKPNPSLLSSHPVVNFGGVQIGKEAVRNFTLRNPTPNDMTLNVAMARTGIPPLHSPNIHVLFLPFPSLSSSLDMSLYLYSESFTYVGPPTIFLNGHAETELAVTYSPRSTLPHRAVVFFEEDFRKSLNVHPAHFQLPLLGYGGSSRVVFETDAVRVGAGGTAHVVARNEGNRAAFIRAACEDGGML